MQQLEQHLGPDQLADYLRGELSADAEHEVEGHISSCLVCARQLQAEAKLEALLFEAAEQAQPPAAHAAAEHRAWTGWQRVATVAAAAVASAAALLLVLAPPSLGEPKAPPATAAAATPDLEVHNPFVNDSALCFPSAVEDAGVCTEPLAMAMTTAMTTDPDDYLSPFEPDLGWTRTVGNICVADDNPICEPIAG